MVRSPNPDFPRIKVKGGLTIRAIMLIFPDADAASSTGADNLHHFLYRRYRLSLVHPICDYAGGNRLRSVPFSHATAKSITCGLPKETYMPIYRAPVEDVLFLLNDVFHVERFANLPGFADASPDIVEAILSAAGKFC